MVLVVLEVPSDTASAESPRCAHLPRQKTAAGTLNTDTATPIVNPPRACAARVTVVGVCLSVCLLLSISLLEYLLHAFAWRVSTLACYLLL